MIDLDELERKANAAAAKDALSFDEDTFSAYITPEIVCELINRLRESESKLNTLILDMSIIAETVMNVYASPTRLKMFKDAIDAAMAKDTDNE